MTATAAAMVIALISSVIITLFSLGDPERSYEDGKVLLVVGLIVTAALYFILSGILLNIVILFHLR
jgi:hypothetical protein